MDSCTRALRPPGRKVGAVITLFLSRVEACQPAIASILKTLYRTLTQRICFKRQAVAHSAKAKN
jgi:hypothetical protein